MDGREQLVLDALCDGESRVYYEARKAIAEKKSFCEFYKIIRKNQKVYRFRDIDSFAADKDISGWCVWGTDDIGCYHYRLLRDAGFVVAGVVEASDCSSGSCGKIPVLPADEALALLTERKYALLITDAQAENLPEKFMQCENILCVQHHLVGRCGWQYFDYFAPNPGEVFIDGGALDGATGREFITWCGGEFDKIFAFEPNPGMIEICRKNIKEMGEDKITFFPKGLWKKSAVLHFDNQTKSKWDACLDENGETEVECISIDEAVEGEKVTFIKLDVEGSELEVLMGAEKCIKRSHPRMAIRIYHKDYDFIDIPAYLLSLDPAYRFSIRHYHSDCIETVLYAFREAENECVE